MQYRVPKCKTTCEKLQIKNLDFRNSTKIQIRVTFGHAFRAKLTTLWNVTQLPMETVFILCKTPGAIFGIPRIPAVVVTDQFGVISDGEFLLVRPRYTQLSFSSQMLCSSVTTSCSPIAVRFCNDASNSMHSTRLRKLRVTLIEKYLVFVSEFPFSGNHDFPHCEFQVVPHTQEGTTAFQLKDETLLKHIQVCIKHFQEVHNLPCRFCVEVYWDWNCILEKLSSKEMVLHMLHIQVKCRCKNGMN